MVSSRTLSIVEVVVACALLLVAFALLVPTHFHHRHERSHQTRCSNALRQIGLAAIQYGDDKRFLPHVRALDELDGDAETDHTPRVMRALVYYGYHDNPEGFICPSSEDVSLPITDERVHENMRLWAFGREDLEPGSPAALATPWSAELPQSLELVHESELSYAYTRRAYSRNLSSTRVLGADRSMRVEPVMRTTVRVGEYGNHEGGWNVLRADATVDWRAANSGAFPEGAGRNLIGTEKGQAALPLAGHLAP